MLRYSDFSSPVAKSWQCQDPSLGPALPSKLLPKFGRKVMNRLSSELDFRFIYFRNLHYSYFPGTLAEWLTRGPATSEENVVARTFGCESSNLSGVDVCYFALLPSGYLQLLYDD